MFFIRLLTCCLAVRYSLVLVICSLIAEIVAFFSPRALLLASSSESFLLAAVSFICMTPSFSAASACNSEMVHRRFAFSD